MLLNLCEDSCSYLNLSRRKFMITSLVLEEYICCSMQFIIPINIELGHLNDNNPVQKKKKRQRTGASHILEGSLKFLLRLFRSSSRRDFSASLDYLHQVRNGLVVHNISSNSMSLSDC